MRANNFLKPNILFLVLDGLSGEKFFGKTKTSKTPNIDSWIKKGVYFSQTICSAQGTVPAVSSMLTSLYPFECVVQAKDTYVIDPKIKTLIHYLKENGYNTYATYQNVISFLGLNQIFSSVDTYDVTFEEMKMQKVHDKIIENFSDHSLTEPWIHYLQVYDLHLLAYPIEYRLKNGSPEIQDEYYGENYFERIVSSMDIWLGKLLSKINLDNTLVIVTADHGLAHSSYDSDLDAYYDETVKKREHKPGKSFKYAHKIITKFPKFLIPIRKKLSKTYAKRENSKILLEFKPEYERINNLDISIFKKRLMKNAIYSYANVYDERFRVPLLFFGNGIIDPKIISQQVRSVDIFPTLLNILEINFNLKEIQGQSLLPLFKGEKLEELPVLVEAAPNSPKFFQTNIIGVRTSNFKYFRNKYDESADVHLYNLKIDPLEENNIVESNFNTVKKMEEILIKLQNERGFECGKTEQILDIDEEKKIEQELRKLGYM
jgi:arylsulfatase A-like enzyme